jgi:hypothetical protein
MPGRLVAATLLACLGGGAAARAAQDEADRAPRTDADRRVLAEAGAIEEEIARLRERPFLGPVKTQVYTREQLAGFLEEQLRDPEAIADLEREERQLRAFGFLPDDVSLGELLKGVLGSQIAGFYDPKDRTLRCITTDVAFLQRLTLVHEIYHALQDQYSPLEPFMEGKPAGEGEEGDGDDAPDLTNDAARARQALVEGDAQHFTMNVYMPEHGETVAEDLTSDSPGALLGVGFGQALAQASIPPYFVDMLTWPYMGGAKFVAALREAGGWTAVDRAFAAPPLSTEQILHPRKYLDASDPPLAVVARAPAFARDWKELQRETLGEAEIAALLLHLGKDAVHATRGSEGWGGDELMILESPQATPLLVWRLRFDSERDGEQFFAAWRRLLVKTYDATDATPAPPLVAELAAGATSFVAVAPRDAALPERLRSPLAAPGGASFCIAEQEGSAPSWLARRGAEVLLLRGKALQERTLADLVSLEEELKP